LWELEPGREGVYHFHLGNEELLAVLRGRPTLRTPEGSRELVEGEAATFPRGPLGAHTVSNQTGESVRFLFFSEMRGPEVVLYPDAGAVAALEAMSSPEQGGFAAWLRLEDAFERHDGDPPEPGSVPAAEPARANLGRPDFDAPRDRPGFCCRRARIGRQAGSERLGASLYELPPGQAPWPYHYHLANEELLVALQGTPSVRTPRGRRTLAEGEVLSFPAGERGLHQVRNEGDDAARTLVVSQMVAPDVVVHQESGKIGARAKAPGSAEESGLEAWLPIDSRVDFWEGE
jgi:uncharacterized cupin superfamily protein